MRNDLLWSQGSSKIIKWRAFCNCELQQEPVSSVEGGDNHLLPFQENVYIPFFIFSCFLTKQSLLKKKFPSRSYFWALIGPFKSLFIGSFEPQSFIETKINYSSHYFFKCSGPQLNYIAQNIDFPCPGLAVWPGQMWRKRKTEVWQQERSMPVPQGESITDQL